MTPFHTQKIKEAADILDVVSRFIDMKKAGVRYVGLCPFHQERSPSFYVNQSKQFYHCFGCGEHGDIFQFIERHLNLSFMEAKKYLAGLYNLDAGTPQKDFTPPPRPARPPEPQPSFFPKAAMLATLKAYRQNNFAKFLNSRFGADATSEVIARYFVGTSKYFPGGNIFWQIDFEGRVRGGKIMAYNPSTGKRDRDKSPTWAHKAAKIQDFVLGQCFFGEHLLSKRPTAPVCIVESEKTAILASIYLPGSVWVACGGKDQLSQKKCAVLIGRTVTLWPDAGAYQLWMDRARELNKAGYSVRVSNLIETLATDAERANGFDLADYLLRFDLAEFKAAQDVPESPTPPDVTEDERGYPTAWDEPTPPQPSRLEAAAAIMAAHGWTAGRVQPYTDESEAEWAAKRERARRWYPGAFGITRNAAPAHITRNAAKSKQAAL